MLFTLIKNYVRSKSHLSSRYVQFDHHHLKHYFNLVLFMLNQEVMAEAKQTWVVFMYTLTIIIKTLFQSNNIYT